MIEQEEWREIPGWEGLYSVSTYGNVKSHQRIISEKRKEDWKPKIYTIKEKILKASKQKCGHLRVSLSMNGKITYHLIHKLVLFAFIGIKPSRMECCHKDGNPSNNKLSNLYYGTRSQNIADAKRHGTFPIGSQRPGAILTAQEALEIYAYCKQGFKDKDIAKQYGVTKGCVVQIRLGNNWKEITGGERISKR